MDFIFQDFHYSSSMTFYHKENPIVKCMRMKGDEGITALKNELEKGLDFDACCYGMILACYLGNYDVVDTFVQFFEEKQCSESYVWDTPQVGRKRSILNTYNDVGSTPLLSAICGNHIDICCLLIEEGADVNLAHQMSKQSPLIMAIEHGHTEIVELLLNNNADVQQCDNVGITPLYSAIKTKDETLVKWLLERDCDINLGSQDHSPLFLATRMAHLGFVKLLLESGCHKDIQNKYGVTSVYEAAMKGHAGVLKHLLTAGCDANIVDMYGQSPLHVAVMTNKLECVKILVEANVNLKLRNHNRDSAMDMCLQMGHAAILEYFLENGIEVLPRITDPCSVRHIVGVFEQGHTWALEVLLRGCPMVPMLHCVGVIPMFKNNLKLIKLLMHSGIEKVPTSIMAADTHGCKDTSDWLKEFRKTPRSLKDTCRLTVRRCLGNKVLYNVKTLPIPTELKHYIALRIL